MNKLATLDSAFQIAFDVLESWWAETSAMLSTEISLSDVLSICANINDDPTCLKFTLPELKGRLLYILSDPGLLSVISNALQTNQLTIQQVQPIESAILNILSYVQSQPDYINVVTHMSLNPEQKNTQDEGESRLYNILNTARTPFARLQKLHLALSVKQGLLVYRAQPLINQPVQPNATIVSIRGFN